ncbi:MAG: heterocyst frequency control protein PatD [Cyanobacteria bacterium P01_D01_bin.44]
MQSSETLKVALQAFERQLVSLQASLAHGVESFGELQTALASLNKLFQTQIRAQVMADIEQSDSAVSIITEMHRHLRLLGVDLNFLRAAQQSTTRQQRQQRVEQRLISLKEFSQGLLTLIS